MKSVRSIEKYGGGGCYGLNAFSPNSCVEAVNSNVTVFRDGTPKKVINVK